MGKSHNPVKKIWEIPEIEGDFPRGSKFPYRTKTFVLVLRVMPLNNKRCVIEATDFTANNQISDEIGEDEKDYRFLKVDENKVLRIIGYRDKFLNLCRLYETAFPDNKIDLAENNPDGGFLRVLDDKLLIMSLTLKWREYNGKLEPYAYDPDVVEWDCLEEHEKPVVSALYKKILKRKQYIKSLEGLEKVIIPEEFTKNVSNDDDDDDISEMSLFEDDLVEQSLVELAQVSQVYQYGNNEVDDSAMDHNHIANSIERDLSRDQNGVGGYSPLLHAPRSVIEVPISFESGNLDGRQKSQETRHKRAKSELEFQEAAKRSKQESSTPDENETRDDQTQNNNVVGTKRISSAKSSGDGLFFRIDELNKLDNTVDGKTYNVVCEILHATPSDKEWFSYKPYEVNPLTQEKELSHTRLQGIEFIITDAAKPNNHELLEGEYLSIYLDGDQVLALTKTNCVTRKLLNFAWDNTHDDAIMILKLCKVQREVVVWTVQW